MSDHGGMNATAPPDPTYHGPDFRTWPPETVTDEKGRAVAVVRCEELVGDRWEPFISIHRRAEHPA